MSIHVEMSTEPRKPLLVAMISSTARDLPEHRQQVMNACLAQQFFPKMMEHLPASDADATAASMKMVDEADLYIGVLGWRYGFVPEGSDVSITELEYNRATARGIPRLMFLMDEDHPVKGSEVEKGAGAIKLQAFKERVAKTHVVNFFKSPEDLRSQVTNTLSQVQLSPENGSPGGAGNGPPTGSQKPEHAIVVPNVRELKGRQLQAAMKAIGAAYSTKAGLAQMVKIYFGENLEAIVGGSSLDDVIFNLLEWARMRGKTTELLQGAVDGNPTNPELRDFVKSLE